MELEESSMKVMELKPTLSKETSFRMGTTFQFQAMVVFTPKSVNWEKWQNNMGQEDKENNIFWGRISNNDKLLLLEMLRIIGNIRKLKE